MLSTILASVTIAFVPFGGIMGYSGLKCGNYGGVYVPSQSAIYLCQGVQGNTEFYKYHEVGHHFWYKIMTQKQRDDYVKLYERDLKKGKFYRDYGKASVKEDFADNFGIIVAKIPHNNTRIPFIRKLLK